MPWTLLAAASYAGTVALGVRSLHGIGVKRAWHTRMFVLTVALTLFAIALSVLSDWLQAVLLILALIPLALLPALTAPVRRHSRRHAILGLSAAPCYLAASALAAVGHH